MYDFLINNTESRGVVIYDLNHVISLVYNPDQSTLYPEALYYSVYTCIYIYIYIYSLTYCCQHSVLAHPIYIQYIHTNILYCNTFWCNNENLRYHSIMTKFDEFDWSLNFQPRVWLTAVVRATDVAGRGRFDWQLHSLLLLDGRYIARALNSVTTPPSKFFVALFP